MDTMGADKRKVVQHVNNMLLLGRVAHFANLVEEDGLEL